MMEENKTDIRWIQRFSNYRKALLQLRKAVEIITTQIEDAEDLSDIDELMGEGLIKRFEYTHELSWNVMADYAKGQGIQDIKGPRDAIRYALKNGLIDDEKWMQSIIDRNRSTHTYDQNTAEEIMDAVLNIYHPLFELFESKMEALRCEIQEPPLFE